MKLLISAIGSNDSMKRVLLPTNFQVSLDNGKPQKEMGRREEEIV